MWDWALGQKDSSVFGDTGYWLQYCFYILLCVGLIVITFNLLIAMIGASNAKVMETKQITLYQEFA